ncbi:MAG: cyclophilin-like fold protein [Anaerolineae bacterium]
MRRILITAGEVTLPAELNDSPTADEVWQALPIEGRANTWGDEIYFEIPVVARQAADARADVAVGELGYWPIGRAFCIFFGPTPASKGDAPRAYSPVNILGRVLGDATAFRRVRDGDPVRLTRAAVETSAE